MYSFHGHPFARKHVRLSILPRLAANPESSSSRNSDTASHRCISHSSASTSPSITATVSGFIHIELNKLRSSSVSSARALGTRSTASRHVLPAIANVVWK